MSYVLSPEERHLVLASAKALVCRWLCRYLAEITPDDVLAMSSEEHLRLAAVLDRLPEDIPADLVAPLRAALPSGKEVAA